MFELKSMIKKFLKYAGVALLFLLIVLQGVTGYVSAAEQNRGVVMGTESLLTASEIQDYSTITFRKFVLPDNGCLRESVSQPSPVQVRVSDRSETTSFLFVQSYQKINYKINRITTSGFRAQLYSQGHYLYALCQLII